MASRPTRQPAGQKGGITLFGNSGSSAIFKGSPRPTQQPAGQKGGITLFGNPGSGAIFEGSPRPTQQPAGQKGGITLFGHSGSGALFDAGNTSAGPDYLSWTDGAGNPVGYGSGLGGAASGVASLPTYPHAPMASQYGMDQATAYQEALANTAHMREVYDLKLAGLNPVLSATGGRGASVFSGDVAYPMAFGATSSTGGSSASAVYSGGGAGGSKGSSAAGTLKAWLKGDYNAQSAVASVASAVVGGVTKSFPLGAAAYYATKSILGNIFRR